jgi:hypothetical protein
VGKLSFAAKGFKGESDPAGPDLQNMIIAMLSVLKKVVDMTNAALARNGTQCVKFTDPKYCKKKKKKKRKKK